MSISNVQSADPSASFAHDAGSHDQLTAGDLVVGVVIGRICQSFDLFVFGLGCVLAFPAVFLVLLAGMWKGFAAARPWLVSLVVAATVYLTVPGAWYVATGALSGLIAAYVLAGEK